VTPGPWPGMDWWHVMAELLFSPVLWWGIGAGAAVFAALAVFRKKPSPLWAALSVLCLAGGVLLALLQGRTLEDALPLVLSVAAIALAGLCWRGDGE